MKCTGDRSESSALCFEERQRVIWALAILHVLKAALVVMEVIALYLQLLFVHKRNEALKNNRDRLTINKKIRGSCLTS